MAWLRKAQHTDQSDEQLAEQYRLQGDQAVLGMLYSRYLELIYGLCLQYLKDAGRAEDAVMDIYVQLQVKLKEHEIEKFRAWIYRLSRNHCLMLLRKTASSHTLKSSSVSDSQLIELDGVQLADISHQVDESNQREDMLNALETCREQLPEGQHECIRRFYLEGESYSELATSLGWELSKVRSAIQNGRRNLKICIERKTSHVNS